MTPSKLTDACVSRGCLCISKLLVLPPELYKGIVGNRDADFRTAHLEATRLNMRQRFVSFPPARPNRGNAAATMTRKTNKASDNFDWSRFDALTDEQVHAAALADPDAQPWTEDQLAKAKRTPRVKIIRRALKLTQEQFARQFGIPLGTLRDWEQGRKDPD